MEVVLLTCLKTLLKVFEYFFVTRKEVQFLNEKKVLKNLSIRRIYIFKKEWNHDIEETVQKYWNLYIYIKYIFDRLHVRRKGSPERNAKANEYFY
ncbi:hypothetical protein PSKAS_26020 [Peribacillus sp. N1]